MITMVLWIKTPFSSIEALDFWLWNRAPARYSLCTIDSVQYSTRSTDLQSLFHRRSLSYHPLWHERLLNALSGLLFSLLWVRDSGLLLRIQFIFIYLKLERSEKRRHSQGSKYEEWGEKPHNNIELWWQMERQLLSGSLTWDAHIHVCLN